MLLILILTCGKAIVYMGKEIVLVDLISMDKVRFDLNPFV